jgi:hypothetical protein
MDEVRISSRVGCGPESDKRDPPVQGFGMDGKGKLSILVLKDC